MTWAAIIDAAAAKWPQTDAMGRTLADDAADLIESRQVRETRSGAWRVDAAGAAANVAKNGVTGGRVAGPLESIALTDAIEIIPATRKCRGSLEALHE